MEEVSHVGKDQCCSGCINPLLQHNIGDTGYSGTTREDTDNTDTDSITLPEETISLVQASTDTPGGYLCIVWISLLILSILLISLYSAGYLVLMTVILCCSICLVLVYIGRLMCGQRDMYSEL
eukprot:GFUD01006876.1.p1 GENE.GFUD01006876.1~~GFUD01006876.1.p1  ORF type:complete len:123 (-),score=15.72 GFUD01006876.1:339-707(-)